MNSGADLGLSNCLTEAAALRAYVDGADVRFDAVWHRGPGSEADDTFPVAGGFGQPAGTTRLCMYTTKMCRHVGLSSGLCNLPPSAIGTFARCVPSQR